MKLKLVLTVCLAAVLSACTTTDYVRHEVTYDEAASNKFSELNKEAITKLMAGFDIKNNENIPILVATITNINDVQHPAPLGRTLSGQYASYMSDLGFDVKEMTLRGDVYIERSVGELLLSREIKDIAKSHRANYVVVGTYSQAENFTYINLKFVKTEDGRIIKGYNYTLPNDKDILKLLKHTVPRP